MVPWARWGQSARFHLWHRLARFLPWARFHLWHRLARFLLWVRFHLWHRSRQFHLSLRLDQSDLSAPWVLLDLSDQLARLCLLRLLL